MREASRAVLDGFELGTDAQTVRYPDRFVDKGAETWERMTKLIPTHLSAATVARKQRSQPKKRMLS
jgi:hypothetical protein